MDLCQFCSSKVREAVQGRAGDFSLLILPRVLGIGSIEIASHGSEPFDLFGKWKQTVYIGCVSSVVVPVTDLPPPLGTGLAHMQKRDESEVCPFGRRIVCTAQKSFRKLFRCHLQIMEFMTERMALGVQASEHPIIAPGLGEICLPPVHAVTSNSCPSIQSPHPSGRVSLPYSSDRMIAIPEGTVTLSSGDGSK